jgi:hypothetical protein
MAGRFGMAVKEATQDDPSRDARCPAGDLVRWCYGNQPPLGALDP